MNNKQTEDNDSGSGSGLLIFSCIVLILGAIFVNYKYLNIRWWYFTGIILAGLLLFSVFANLVIRYFKKKKATDDSFIFPEELANKMKNISIGVQYEAAILSIAFIMTGMTLFSIYFVFYLDFTWGYKVFYVFNYACGFVLMGSMLLTNYQQYVYWKQSMTQIIGVDPMSQITEVVKEKAEAKAEARANAKSLYDSKLKGGIETKENG